MILFERLFKISLKYFGIHCYLIIGEMKTKLSITFMRTTGFALLK